MNNARWKPDWIKWTPDIDTDLLELASEYLIFGYPLYGSKKNAQIYQGFWSGKHFCTYYDSPRELIPLYYLSLDDIPLPEKPE